MLAIVPVYAKTLKGTISLDWDGLSQTEITQDINDKRDITFSKELSISDKKEFKNRIKQYKKDSNRKDNYKFANSGGGELSDRIVVPFFYKKYLYAYGIIYKDNLRTCYYYNAFGGLFNVEYFEKDYGIFPVISYQYKPNGNFMAAVYNITDIDQYMYNQDKNFIGRWYKENYYNGSGKITMTRTLPEK